MAGAHLHALYYSPWSERARWALDHHRVKYAYHEHIPMVLEPRLRRLARKGGRDGKASVPLYIDDTGVYGDSMDIVDHAEKVGSRDSLGDLDVARRWSETVDPALQAGRARVTARILASKDALRESAMAVAPGFLAGAMRPAAAMGAKFVARKYACDLDAIDKQETIIAKVLHEVRAKLDGGKFLEGDRFSASDIVTAVVLQMVAPVEASHMNLPAGLHDAWSSRSLAREFGDLIEWRDALYARHRPYIPAR